MRQLIALFLVIAAGVVSTPRNAAAANSAARLTVGEQLATWEPLVEYEQLFLRVAWPDGRVRQVEFGAGSHPVLHFDDKAVWQDGTYIWELIAIPPATGLSQPEPRVESGAFRILAGAGVRNGLRDGETRELQRLTAPSLESLHEPDQQIGDDLIVTGAACVGLACVNGEAFTGNDTLWLKQEVVRLKFVDTSTGGFPANDWQIVANDPLSGEADRFSIQDLTGEGSPVPFTIFAGAPTNRLVVTSGGVGIDTATPSANLHIFGPAGADTFNAVGPNPATDALNFGYSGSTFGAGSGFFNVRPTGAAPNPALYFATGNVDRMMVDNEGFIAVHMDGALGNNFNPAHPIHSQTSGAHLTAGGIWTNASSRDLKEEIAPLDAEAALQALALLEPVNFRYKLEPEDPHVGFISEEVPELVATPDRKTLSPMDIVAVLTRVVQEQEKRLVELREEVAQLRAAAQVAQRPAEMGTGAVEQDASCSRP
jgi:hypothetical protein